ncbi:MAG TPA: AI-2E family transporter [Oculatellaceae cyanobacterium]
MKIGQWIGFFALIISLYILWELRQLLLLVFAAVLVATSLNQLARQLRKFGLPRPGSVLLALGIFLAVLVGFFFIIVPPFISQFQELTSTKLPQVLQLFNSWRNQLTTLIPPQMIQYLPDVNSLNNQVQPLLQGLAGRSLAFFSSSLGVLLNFLLVIVLTLMLLAQPTSYRKAFVRLFPSFYRRRADGILDQCEFALGKWIIGALISMTVVACLSVIGLWVLGVPVPLAQGVLAGLLNFIPNIGPTLSVVLPMAISLLDAPWKAGAVFIVYFLIQQFETNLLTPYVMAQQVSLLPAVTLLAQVFFATFFGILGFLLALPLTVVGQVWVQEVLVKDILDQWNTEQKNQTELVVVSDSVKHDERRETTDTELQS